MTCGRNVWSKGRTPGRHCPHAKLRAILGAARAGVGAGAEGSVNGLVRLSGMTVVVRGSARGPARQPVRALHGERREERLSCTAKITTATRQHVVTIPIQALTIRQKGDLEAPPKNATVQAAKSDPVAEKARKEEIQGVFVIASGKAVFRKVETGITGSTDIEVLSGLKEGDEIVTGSYQVIRTIRNEAPVKVDNKAPLKINT